MKSIGGFSTVFFTQHTEHKLTCFPRSLPVVFTSPGSTAWLSKDFDSDILQCLSKAAEICSFRFTVCNHFSLLPATSLAFTFHVLGGSLASTPGNRSGSLLLKRLCNVFSSSCQSVHQLSLPHGSVWIARNLYIQRYVASANPPEISSEWKTGDTG